MTDDGSTLPAPRDEVGPVASPRLREDEAGAILRRAAQRSLRRDLPSPHDLTLQGLMEVAAEVGLDPADVRRAAAVRPSSDSAVQRTVFGGQTGRTVRASSPHGLPSSRTALVGAAEAVVGGSGKEVRSEADRWSWEAGGILGHTRATLRQADGGTEVVVSGNRTGAFAATYVPLLVGLGALSGTLGLFGAVTATAGPLVALLGLFGVPLLLARPLFRRGDAEAADRMEQLTMELLRALEAEER